MSLYIRPRFTHEQENAIRADFYKRRLSVKEILQAWKISESMLRRVCCATSLNNRGGKLTP